MYVPLQPSAMKKLVGLLLLGDEERESMSGTFQVLKEKAEKNICHLYYYNVVIALQHALAPPHFFLKKINAFGVGNNTKTIHCTNAGVCACVCKGNISFHSNTRCNFLSQQQQGRKVWLF